VFAEAHADANLYDTCFSLRGKARRIFEPGGMVDERLRIFEQRPAGIREVHTSLVTSEQPQTQLALQLLDLATERRLADIQPPRSSREIQVVSKGDEVAKLPQFHERMMLYGSRILIQWLSVGLAREIEACRTTSCTC